MVGLWQCQDHLMIRKGKKRGGKNSPDWMLSSLAGETESDNYGKPRQECNKCLHC